MARYIDADRLLLVLEKNFGHAGGADTLKQLIDIQPTADVEEVKHGRWEIKTYKKQGKKFITCSNCTDVIDCSWMHIDENEFDYCPYCGAKMDGGKTE